MIPHEDANPPPVVDGYEHPLPQLSYTMRMYLVFALVGWVSGAATVIVLRMIFG